MGVWIYVERRLGGIVVITPVAIEVWMSLWWNNRGHAGSGRGSRAPVDCARSRPSHLWERVPWLGPPVAPRLARGLHVSLGQGGSMPRGSGAFDDVTRARARRKLSPEAPISPETFPQARVGWSLSFMPRATDMLSAPFAGRFYWGPYNGALAIVHGVVFCHLLGTLLF
jgi:hypothetical protein